MVITLAKRIALSVLGKFIDNPVFKGIPTIAQTVGHRCTLVVPGPGGVGEPVDHVVRLPAAAQWLQADATVPCAALPPGLPIIVTSARPTSTSR